MDLIGTRVFLDFAEPWDSDKVIKGRITRLFTEDEKPYYLIEDDQSPERYLVSTRYVGEQLTDVFIKGVVIVGIFLIEEFDLSSSETELFNHLSYKGHGSINLLPTTDT